MYPILQSGIACLSEFPGAVQSVFVTRECSYSGVIWNHTNAHTDEHSLPIYWPHHTTHHYTTHSHTSFMHGLYASAISRTSTNVSTNTLDEICHNFVLMWMMMHTITHTHTNIHTGKYTVRLWSNFDEKYVNVTVDDFIPVVCILILIDSIALRLTYKLARWLTRSSSLSHIIRPFSDSHTHSRRI